MAQKSKGQRNKTRKKLKKHSRDKETVTSHLKSFDVGQKVNIKIDSSIHRGIPHPRFHGKNGKVVGKQGRSYVIEVKDVKKKKKLTVYPSHLKEVKQ